MHEFAVFFAGALLCNALPHLAAGLLGEKFPTPFAKPHGRGPSSPLVNFLWGAANFIVGALLLGANPVAVGLNVDFGLVCLGALALGASMAVHFGKVRESGSFTP